MSFSWAYVRLGFGKNFDRIRRALSVSRRRKERWVFNGASSFDKERTILSYKPLWRNCTIIWFVDVIQFRIFLSKLQQSCTILINWLEKKILLPRVSHVKILFDLEKYISIITLDITMQLYSSSKFSRILRAKSWKTYLQHHSFSAPRQSILFQYFAVNLKVMTDFDFTTDLILVWRIRLWQEGVFWYGQQINFLRQETYHFSTEWSQMRKSL